MNAVDRGTNAEGVGERRFIGGAAIAKPRNEGANGRHGSGWLHGFASDADRLADGGKIDHRNSRALYRGGVAIGAGEVNRVHIGSLAPEIGEVQHLFPDRRRVTIAGKPGIVAIVLPPALGARSAR